MANKGLARKSRNRKMPAIKLMRNSKVMVLPLCGENFWVINANGMDKLYTHTSAPSVVRANASRLDPMIKRPKPANVTSGDSTRK
jgi:hypothetical protein